MAAYPQPTLSAAMGLTLRPWSVDDCHAVFEAFSDVSISHWHGLTLTKPAAEEWIAGWRQRWDDETDVSWAVTRDDRVLGQVGLRRIIRTRSTADVSYWTVPRARRQGVATEALTATAAWAFADLGLHRLELSHSTHNDASCQVAARARFRFEGTRRSSAYHADGWHDMHLHGLLCEDPGLW